MPYYYDDHHDNHDLTRQLAHHLSRESRYTGHPTQYIVNEGRMFVDRKTLQHSNAVIYNAPGSSLRVSPSRSTSTTRTRSTSYYAPKSSWSPSIHTCRGCLERREIYFEGYCHDCNSLRLVSSPRESYRLRDRDYRYLARAPERRMVGWY
ncbi:hypothetical protein F5Y05DRAFT_381117 [Hypoxylon sp. FL0543]|nr:hypothetical protein F5Y05DRAFT_381117 [Hypoxylon sp. FL0543]